MTAYAMVAISQKVSLKQLFLKDFLHHINLLTTVITILAHK